eukprot:scaffold2880_cov379-Pavlova_lutheri.AAC.4
MTMLVVRFVCGTCCGRQACGLFSHMRQASEISHAQKFHRSDLHVAQGHVRIETWNSCIGKKVTKLVAITLCSLQMYTRHLC